MEDRITRAGYKIEKLQRQLKAAEQRNWGYAAEINRLQSILIAAIRDEAGWLERALSAIPERTKAELANDSNQNL